MPENYRINIEGQGPIEAVQARFVDFLDWLQRQGSATGSMKSASELHGTTDIDSTQGGE